MLLPVSHDSFHRFSKNIALVGIVLPLLLIGILKFTPTEIEALKPIISGTPWLAWLYSAFGFAGTSYLLGTVELITTALLIASPWSALAGMLGGILAAGIFLTTFSTLLALPVWLAKEGGFPMLNGLGTFLIKDMALVGASLLIFSDSYLAFSITAGKNSE